MIENLNFVTNNFPNIPVLDGVCMATTNAGIKQKDRTDLLFLIFDKSANVAGVFTRSHCPSAPVDHCKKILSHGKARGLIVNSGNANAFTGKKGKKTTDETAKTAACILNCAEEEIYLASTGVIGEPLDVNLLVNPLPRLAAEAQQDGWHDAAVAIMTTDTFPKGATRTIYLDGQNITIIGIAKGSGMISPDMATMLAFVVTDAPVSSTILQDILSNAVRSSFNSITVDGDTSTSDMVLLFATGSAAARGVKEVMLKSNSYTIFSKSVKDLLLELALQIVRDGEGAKKLVEVSVTGAISNHSAERIARSIANSPLVKTSIAGEDANWGRVVMAVGKSGEKVDRDLLSIWFGKQRLAINGERDPTYEEEIISCYMKNRIISIRADIGLGNGRAKIWTCDLTKDYVMINGNYRS